MWAWNYNAVMTCAIRYSWQEAKILCNFVITFFLLISCWGIEHSLHSLSVHRRTLPLLLPGRYRRRWTVLFLDWGPTQPWRRGRVSKRPPLDSLGTYKYKVFPMVEHHLWNQYSHSAIKLIPWSQTYSMRQSLEASTALSFASCCIHLLTHPLCTQHSMWYIKYSMPIAVFAPRPWLLPEWFFTPKHQQCEPINSALWLVGVVGSAFCSWTFGWILKIDLVH